MDLHLKDHVAVITGGASGIGYAAAEAFAQEGAAVAIWDHSELAHEAVARISKTYHVPARAYVFDISTESAVLLARDATMAAFGQVDHLVHAAAIGSGKFGFPFTNLSPDDWPRVLNVNIMGMVNVAHAVAPTMVDRGSGTLIFLASVAGQIGSQTDPPYSASKAANINFAQCLAKDLATHKVRVNTICPGMVKTALNRSVWQAWFNQAAESERLPYDEWAARKIKSIVPLGEWQSAEDIADLIVFLSSDRARHITGQTINVDGGFVMHW